MKFADYQTLLLIQYLSYSFRSFYSHIICDRAIILSFFRMHFKTTKWTYKYQIRNSRKFFARSKIDTPSSKNQKKAVRFVHTWNSLLTKNSFPIRVTKKTKS